MQGLPGGGPPAGLSIAQTAGTGYDTFSPPGGSNPHQAAPAAPKTEPMRNTRRHLALVLTAAVGLPGAVQAGDPAPTAAAVEFFEKEVRPVLAEHCYSCHGPKKQQAGLRLDSADGVRKGGDDGPVVGPGDPAKTRLVQAIRRAGDLPMPPDKPLPPAAVAVLTEWVRLGAPFPAAAAARSAPVTAGKDHWAFRPVADPSVPATKTDPGTANPLDRFILAKLEDKGLTLSPRADKRTLIRRATFDLIGLPPTAEEVEAFEADPAPNAFARLVDKLLASPHYGERWGRHWLDVARYADSKGYVFTEDRTYPFAYTYRDYVIRAFNEDKPYDRFVTEQLAADKLPAGPDNKPLAALGFLTTGRRFMNNPHDIIDDRIDVVSRGLMGLTVSCARCHDHKFDPIPTADYYSLYGVFASTVEPKDPPLLDPHDVTGMRAKFEAEYAKKRKAADDFAADMYATHLAKFRTADAVAHYLMAARDARGKTPAEVDALATARKLEPVLITRWRDYLGDPARKADPVFGPWVRLAPVPDGKFADVAFPLLRTLADPGGPAVNPRVLNALQGHEIETLREVAEVYGVLFAEAARPTPDGKPDPARDQIAAVLAPGKKGPTDLPVPMADKFVPIPVKKQFRALRNAADKFRGESPDAPARAMAVADAPDLTEPVVFLRGNPNNPGPKVPRRFLAAVSATDRKPFTGGSGRLDLAAAIVRPDNPLTARVMANRVWAHHFGAGLVRTPSDFGVRADPPTHPELLDWLAKRFVADGWSVKQLHRRIMLSATYQQESGARPALTTADPENRLLGRQARQRLELEPLRDSMLAVAGTLDRTIGGRPVQLFADKPSPRRAVYGFIDRQNLPGAFRVFDFASPDQHTPQRFLTTVPQQALFLLNSPFVVEQARRAAARPEVAAAADAGGKVRSLYRAILSRDPSADEAAAASEFVAGATPPAAGQLGAWELVAQVLLASNEFAFVD